MRLAQVAMGGEEMESGWVGVTHDHWVQDQGRLLEEEMQDAGDPCNVTPGWTPG